MRIRSPFAIAAFGVWIALALGCPPSSQNPDSGGSPDSGNNIGQDAAVGNDSGAGNDAGNDGGGRPDSGSGIDSGANIDSGTAPDAATVTVTAIRIVHHITDTIPFDVPQDFSAYTVNVFVPDSTSATGYYAYPGSGTDAGTISVPNVPATVSSFYLQYDNIYVEGLSTATIDLSVYESQRAGVATGDAGIQFQLTGLTPWTRSDEVFVVSGGANFVQEVPLTLADGGPAITAGGTTLASTAWYGGSLIDGTQGDLTTTYQLALESDGGAPFAWGCSAGHQTSSLQMVNGTMATLSEALTALPQTGQANWMFDQVGFDALGGYLNVNAVRFSQSFGVAATPGGGLHGPVTIGRNMFVANALLSTPWSAAGTYGNPFPSDWGIYGYVEMEWAVPERIATADGGSFITADGGALIDREALTATYQDTLANLPAPNGALLSPLIGPPKSVQVDRNSIDNGGTFGSLQPLLTWSPPTVGTPLYYVVQLERVLIEPNGFVFRATTSIYTTETSLRIFPGVLQSGGAQYLIFVAAVARPNGSIAQPFVGSFPQGTAETVSGVWRTN
jgi:hypothetical protein